MIVGASGLGSLLNSSEFVPYVYGRASGRPSKGRPEKVLANPDLPEPIIRRLAAGPEPPSVPDKPLCGKEMRGYRGAGPATCARPQHETGRCRSAASMAQRTAGQRASEAAR